MFLGGNQITIPRQTRGCFIRCPRYPVTVDPREVQRSPAIMVWNHEMFCNVPTIPRFPSTTKHNMPSLCQKLFYSTCLHRWCRGSCPLANLEGCGRHFTSTSCRFHPPGFEKPNRPGESHNSSFTLESFKYG